MSSGLYPGLGGCSDITHSYGPHYHGASSDTPNPLPEAVTRLVDIRITSIFADLREIVTQINAHWSRKEALDYTAFEPFYSSILRRLLALQSCLQDTTSECFRLGLLAFLAISTFRVPNTTPTNANNARQFAYLTRSYRDTCRTLEPVTPQLSALIFWLLTLGAISVFDVEDEEWLVEKWNQVAKSLPGARLGWEDARVHLEGLLWIRGAHDDIGKKVYKKLIERSSHGE